MRSCAWRMRDLDGNGAWCQECPIQKPNQINCARLLRTNADVLAITHYELYFLSFFFFFKGEILL